jgi:hypothetical protein
MARILLTTALVLAFSSMSFAGSSTCPRDPVLAADGTTIGPDTVSANTTNFYFVNLSAGHSYVVEVWDPFDPWNLISAKLSLLHGDCTTPDTSTDVKTYEPSLVSTFSDRIAWVQASSIGEVITLQNTDTVNAYKYYIRFTDTTLYNPRWSTFSGFITQWGFQNTTSQDIQGTLTVITTLGGTQANVVLSFTIPANSVVFKIAGPGRDANIGPNFAGNAVFTYVGPPAGIQADCYFLNGTGTVIFPAKFEAVRGHTH